MFLAAVSVDCSQIYISFSYPTHSTCKVHIAEPIGDKLCLVGSASWTAVRMLTCGTCISKTLHQPSTILGLGASFMANGRMTVQTRMI